MNRQPSQTGEIARQHNLDALTGLRFFAAFAVFAAHFFLIEDWLGGLHPSLSHLRNSLVITVYVFFVLSGFILTIAYQRLETGTPDWKERKKFWIARFARMYPVYLISLLWFAPFILTHRYATESTTLATQKTLTSWFAAMFMVQSWISNRFGVAWNGPTWTLSVEAGFYLLFPWLLRGIIRLGTSSLILTGIALTLAGGWALNEPAILGNHTRSPLTLLPIFALGIVCACLYQKCHHLPTARMAGALPILAIILLLAVIYEAIPDTPKYGNTVMLAAICALIYGLASQGWPAKFLARPTMMLLGEASYSFYLLQFPIYYTVLWIWLRFPVIDLITLSERQLTPQAHPWGFLLLFAANQGAALLAFLYVERPLRVYLRKRLGAWLIHEELPKPAV